MCTLYRGLDTSLYTCSDTWVERREACHVMRGADTEILGTREIFALFLSESLMYYFAPDPALIRKTCLDACLNACLNMPGPPSPKSQLTQR